MLTTNRLVATIRDEEGTGADNYASVVPNMTSIYTEEVNISGEADGKAEKGMMSF